MSKSTQIVLARERNARGLTQKQLAVLLGVARSTLSNIENGHVQSWPQLRADAARFFGISSEDLFEAAAWSEEA
jgi:transcriptional regulator with XRE-family HTH domain